MSNPGAQLRETHSKALMRLLIHSGPLTRVQLAERAGLSKQTVSDIVRELELAGWVRAEGKLAGKAGRSPFAYAFEPRSGFAIGVDLGATTLEAAIVDLAGTVLAETTAPIDRHSGRELLTVVERVARELVERAGADWERTRSLAIGTPGIVDPETGVILAANNVAGFGDLHMREELNDRLGVPLVLDNEVNMSAFGEQWQGHGVGIRDFLMLNVGTGVGMGVVLDNEIRRGSRGGAGELAFLPIGGDPFDRSRQGRGVFEHAACAQTLLDRHADAGGTARTIREFFDALVAGDSAAAIALEEHARVLALGIAAVSSVLDPEIVVLGGGVGARPELLDPVRSWLDRLTLNPVPVRTSALGNRAALVGSLGAALNAAHAELFDHTISSGSLPIPRAVSA